jgi:benzoate membrane transport protein
VVIVLTISARGGLSESDVASWIFGGFFLNGLICIVASLLYRTPLVFFWTIPGSVLVGPALTHLSIPEVIGAYLAAGVVLLVLGLSGWVKRVAESVPMPIVMAMVAGVFLRFGIDLVRAFRDDLGIALPMAAAFLALTAAPRLARTLPPLIGALAVGAVAVWLLGRFKPPAGALFAIAEPNLYLPQFSGAAMLELVVPLVITVLGVQNAQGIAILTASGHRPPINAITAICGIGSIFTGLTGTVSTCLTGPVSGVLTSAGEKHRQYTAGIFIGLLAMAFGLLAPLLTRLLLGAPATFVATLAGLALLRVLQGAFVASFGDRFSLGALVCFLVTVADVPILSIGAPFWGLVLGVAASALLERGGADPTRT